MLNTAISDWGAIPFPTLITWPIFPFMAKASIFGVLAASNGVFPFKLGLGRSPIPSSRIYKILKSRLTGMLEEIKTHDLSVMSRYLGSHFRQISHTKD